MEAVERVEAELRPPVSAIKVDDRTEVTPGFKFNDWEMRGVPLRIEIGPKDVEKGTVALARRDMPGKRGQILRPAGRSGCAGRRPAGGHPESLLEQRDRFPR